MIELNSQQRAIIDYLVEFKVLYATREDLEEVISSPASFEADIKQMHDTGLIRATFMDVTIRSTKLPNPELEETVMRTVALTALGQERFGS